MYWLNIVAENANASCHKGHVKVKVIVIPSRVVLPDLNPVSISEDTAIGASVVSIQANFSGIIQFSITGGSIGNAFQIDSMTGDITVSSSLDFETTSVYRLTINATTINGVATDSAIQVINILDVNEQPFFVTPCALNNTCVFRINENEPIGTFVGRVEADDPDLDILTFSVNDTRFAISNNGSITTRAVLDFESEDRHVLTVTVTDGALSVTTQVTVIVNNINENPPIFTQAPNPIGIFESIPLGIDFVQFIAEDPDGDEIIFSLQPSIPSLPFDINSGNGILKTNETLDFETIQEYNITVVASNPGGPSTSVDVLIRVLDVNDNAPVFDQSPYRASVRENSQLGTLVVDVEATDADSMDNGRVGYSIRAGNFNNSFRIDISTGAITVANNIDREVVPNFNLTVVGFDFGVVSMFTTVQVLITVLDVNDNAPVFDPDRYKAMVPETQALQSVILTVMATDLDEPGNPNSEIVFGITGGNNEGAFAINSTSGELILIRLLDFEQQSEYTLQVSASDRGVPVMSGFAPIEVQVENIN